MNNIRLHNPNFSAHAVLSVETQDRFVVFKSWDARHGYSRHIYLTVTKLQAWLEDEDEEAYEERDLHSAVRLYRYHDQLAAELVSITEHNGELDGFILRFNLDPGWLYTALAEKYTDSRLLITTEEKQTQATLKLPRSCQTYIRDVILRDKKLKRAFIKAISRNFIYGKDSVVSLYPDYDGFFFREENGISGGLIVSTEKVRGNNGRQYEAAVYRVHT